MNFIKFIISLKYYSTKRILNIIKCINILILLVYVKMRLNYLLGNYINNYKYN